MHCNNVIILLMYTCAFIGLVQEISRSESHPGDKYRNTIKY